MLVQGGWGGLDVPWAMQKEKTHTLPDQKPGVLALQSYVQEEVQVAVTEQVAGLWLLAHAAAALSAAEACTDLQHT